jgi:hypothetical protein
MNLKVRLAFGCERLIFASLPLQPTYAHKKQKFIINVTMAEDTLVFTHILELAENGLGFPLYPRNSRR